MRRLLGCAAALGLLAAVVPARAEEPPHVALAEGLRANGMADLAKEYLEKLAADPATPAAVKAELPIEFARTALELADDEIDDAKRNSYLDEANGLFEQFIKANAASPRIPQARLELARLTAKRGNIQLDKARRQDEAKEKLAEAAKARPFFVKAAADLKAAADAIDAQLAKLGNPTSPTEKAAKARLVDAKYQAVLEQGVNLFNQSKTTSVPQEQGKFIEDSRKVFQKLGSDTDALKTPFGWLAKAWLFRATAEVDTEENAKAILDAILIERSTLADPAKRLARYFRIVALDDKVKGRTDADGLRKVVAAGNEWRASNRAYAKTFEGRGVTWLLARDLALLAETEIKRDPKDPFKVLTFGTNAQALLTQAEPLFRELMDSDNEYTDRAERQWLRIVATRTAGQTDISKLKGFGPLYVAAQIAAYRAAQGLAALGAQPETPADGDPEKDKKAKELADWTAKRKELVEGRQKVRGLLEEAIKQFDPKKDNGREKVRCQMMLVSAYRGDGDHAPAVRLAEQVARENKNSRGLQAANLALRSASELMASAAETDTDDKGETIHPKDILRKKIRDLAAFIEATWPKEPATDAARHHLAMSFQREQNYVEACSAYARITPAYGAFHATRFQEGVLAYTMARSKEGMTKDQEACVRRAVQNLTDLPPPPANDSDAARAYFQAKSQLGYFYLLPTNKKYAEAEALAKASLEAIPKVEGMEAEDKKEAEYGAQALQLWAVYNQAQVASRAGDVAKALALAEPFADAPPPPADDKAADKVRTVRREVLMLCLRCNVQENKIDRARAILDKLSAEQKAGEFEGASQTSTLLAVISELQGQINEAKKKKDTNPGLFEKTRESVASFLDALSQQKGITDDLKLFLANGYFALEKYDRAAETIRQLPPPVAPPSAKKKPEDVTDEERPAYDDYFKKLRIYRGAQFTLARCLRQEKKYAEADKMIAEMLGNKDKPGWAFQIRDVRHEAIFLLEDQGKYGDAFTKWKEMMGAYNKGLVARPAKDPPAFVPLPPLPASASDKEKEARKKQEAEHRAQHDAKVELWKEQGRKFAEQAARRGASAEYFYYLMRCVYLSQEKVKDAAKRGEALDKWVDSVLKFETNSKDDIGDSTRRMFNDLIEQHKELMDRYKTKGGKLFLDDDQSAKAP